MSDHFERAGRWFLRSGIQEAGGGVARYYRADTEQNRPVSTEITGYAASALAHLHALTGDPGYLERAVAAARFLARDAWRADAGAMPFEIDPPDRAYFFDCGIVVRGLVAVWRATRADELLDCAAAVGRSMARDFHAADGWHPIVTLPEKTPVSRDSARWSRMPGCYQLKSAMGWWELCAATGDTAFRDLYRETLEAALKTCHGFLPGKDRFDTMDRLHAYLYFLEGLLPAAGEARCAGALAEGIGRVACLLRQIEPEFARADVYAQLLRMRVLADAAGAAPLDGEAAAAEAGSLAGFQGVSADPRIDGGYWFGRKNGEWLPHMNPVTTAFAIEALELWERRAGAKEAGRPLI